MIQQEAYGPTRFYFDRSETMAREEAFLLHSYYAPEYGKKLTNQTICLTWIL